jgi:hypothetical protein
MKKLKKIQHMRDQLQALAAILTRWWHPVASTKALDLLYQVMCTVLYRRTAVAIKLASSKVGQFFVVISFAVTLAAGYGASSHPMMASSGFRSSPGHAALGSAICIAPAHCHGHQNGQRRRCICLLLMLFCLTLLVAKDHVMFN